MAAANVSEGVTQMRRTTYNESSLHQANGDGMVEDGIGERDDRDDGAVLALRGWA